MVVTVTIICIFISVNILNSDLYGRLIETKTLIQTSNSENQDNPKLTLILHKYLSDENAVEASLIVSVPRHFMLEKYGDKYKLVSHVHDGYSYDPSGLLNKIEITDSIKRDSYGYTYYAVESERFHFPISPSLNGFPFDDVNIRPMVDLYINGQFQDFDFDVQKRIPGRLLIQEKKDKDLIVELTRTPTEKYLVIISSVIFLLVTTLLTYGLVKAPLGLSKIEELIAVAGYLIAIAGFRELIGLSRNYGTGTLEIIVILLPLICIFSGIIISFFKARKHKKK